VSAPSPSPEGADRSGPASFSGAVEGDGSCRQAPTSPTQMTHAPAETCARSLGQVKGAWAATV